MKKYATVLSILTVIILLHALVLFSCVYSQKDAGELPKKAEAGPAHPPEPRFVINPTPVRPEASARNPSEASRQRLPEAPPIPVNHNYGKPFIYQYAVNGNIPALPGSRNATSGILVDLNTRNVLWAKNPRKAYPIASMTKIMTCLIAYEDVLAGRNGLTLDTPIKVSVAAMKIGGSQVYLDSRETFPLRDLLKAASIKSANDAAYLIAEYVGQGSVESFVKRMNERAAQIHMANTRFHNPHGLPGSKASLDNVSSPEGMARLAEEALRHPQLIRWASTWMDTFRTPGTKGFMKIKNHNYLIQGSPEAAPGVDGLKTGFINRAGFCLTATCLRDNRRLVAVVTGYPLRKERDRFVRKLLDWGYARAADPAAALQNDRKAQAGKTLTRSSKKRTVRKSSASGKKTR